MPEQLCQGSISKAISSCGTKARSRCVLNNPRDAPQSGVRSHHAARRYFKVLAPIVPIPKTGGLDASLAGQSSFKYIQQLCTLETSSQCRYESAFPGGTVHRALLTMRYPTASALRRRGAWGGRLMRAMRARWRAESRGAVLSFSRSLVLSFSPMSDSQTEGFKHDSEP